MADKFYTPKEAAVPNAATDPAQVQRQMSAGVEDAQRRIRRDLEAIDSKIIASNVSSVPSRQSVTGVKITPGSLPGPTFLSISGSDIELSNDISASLANGNFEYPFDYSTIVLTGQKWTGLTSRATAFLYIDRDISSGAISLGATPYMPRYDVSYDADDCPVEVCHFDGTNGGTTLTSEYGRAWTFSASNASLSSTQKVYGATSLRVAGTSGRAYCSIKDCYSALYSSLIGTSAYGCEFDVEFYFRADNIATGQPICSGAGMSWQINLASSKLALYLSSNGSTWDLASATAGSTTLSSNTWYYCSLSFDGAKYRLFCGTLGGTTVKEVEVSSSTRVFPFNYFQAGANYNASSFFTGYIDEFRYSPVCLHITTYSVPSAAFTPDDVHFFDILNMTMLFGHNGAWSKKVRVFVGEAYVKDTGVAAVTPYALNGKSVILHASTLSTGTYYRFYHNLGMIPWNYFFEVVCVSNGTAARIGDSSRTWMQKYNTGAWTVIESYLANDGGYADRLAAMSYQSGSYSWMTMGRAGVGTETMSNYKLRLRADRGW